MLSQFIETVRKANRLVVGGMFYFDSPGHMLSEADLLLRLISHYPLIKARAPIVLLPPTPMSQMIGEILKHHGLQVIIEQQAISLLREIQIFHPDLILDVGQAHWKLAIADRQKRIVGDMYPINLAWALRSEEFTGQLIKLHMEWNATRGQLPLRDAINKIPFDPEFSQFLAGKKYAVVQIKSRLINGTVRLLTGDYYLPALEMLKDKGYTIILAGREPMLEEFKRLDVVDYPRSKFVSPKNDFLLFSRASLGIVSPSGAGLFCDTLGTPCCQIGSWTLIPHPSEKTLMIPSRLKERSSGKILSFPRQVTVFCQSYHDVTGPACFDSKTYEDIPPSAEEICLGVEESLNFQAAKTKPVADHNKRIKELDPAGIWKAAASRMSSFFLSKHPEYLDEDIAPDRPAATPVGHQVASL